MISTLALLGCQPDEIQNKSSRFRVTVTHQGDGQDPADPTHDLRFGGNTVSSFISLSLIPFSSGYLFTQFLGFQEVSEVFEDFSPHAQLMCLKPQW